MSGKTNLQLLERDENRKETFLFKWWNPSAAAVIGFTATIFLRAYQRRPIFSGIQTHILLVAGGFVIGYNVDQYRNGYLAERDAVLRNYIERHPEDFPDPLRKKFAEVLTPWVPIR